MFSHVMIGTNDIEKARDFYTKTLAVLGAREPMENMSASGHKRLFFMHNGAVLGISEPINDAPATCANGATLGFACDSLDQVKEFHDAAVAAGGTSIEDPPGPRENSMGKLNLAYVLDPDGHKLCAMHRPG